MAENWHAVTHQEGCVIAGRHPAFDDQPVSHPGGHRLQQALPIGDFCKPITAGGTGPDRLRESKLDSVDRSVAADVVDQVALAVSDWPPVRRNQTAVITYSTMPSATNAPTTSAGLTHRVPGVGSCDRPHYSGSSAAPRDSRCADASRGSMSRIRLQITDPPAGTGIPCISGRIRDISVLVRRGHRTPPRP